MVTGLQAFNVNGEQVLLATSIQRLLLYDGGSVSVIALLDIGLEDLVTMVQADDVMYGTDGVHRPFKYDGVTATNFTLNDAGGNSLIGIQDMIWFLNRMWYAKGDFVYFSDVDDPETISLPPLRVKVGDGAVIRRLLGYREGLMLAFKYAPSNGPGSIHVLDVSSNDPDQFQQNVLPLFEGLNLCSPRTVIRLGNNQSAELFYATVEGMRSLPFTALDKLVQPSLPFSYHLATELTYLNKLARDTAFTALFNDELLWFVATNPNTQPDYAFCYDMKVPTDDIQKRWTISNLMPATCACVAAINGDPRLYLGTVADTIELGMGVYNLGGYIEVSKRVDFEDPVSNKLPTKLILTLAPDHRGSMIVSLLYDDDTEISLGTVDVQTGGIILPATLPFVIPAGVIQTVALDIRNANAQRKTGKDFRVKIITANRPAIYGWQLEAVLCPTRYKGDNIDEPDSGYGTQLPTENVYGSLPEALGV